MDSAASSLDSCHFLPPRGDGCLESFSDVNGYLAVSVGSWMRRSTVPTGRHGKTALRRLLRLSMLKNWRVELEGWRTGLIVTLL